MSEAVSGVLYGWALGLGGALAVILAGPFLEWMWKRGRSGDD